MALRSDHIECSLPIDEARARVWICEGLVSAVSGQFLSLVDDADVEKELVGGLRLVN